MELFALWPNWALRTIALLCFLVVVVFLLQTVVFPAAKQQEFKEKSIEFRWFQTGYLTVYLIIMLADWLQGTNMYTLYSSYGVDVGTLFLTGFLSSAVFGTFLGMLVDEWGRKFGCVAFCLLEIVINSMEHIPNMPILLVGRVLGGISTSLLFSAFECWMVSAHRSRGYPEDWLTSTFTIASWGNGITAIVAGFIAQLASDVAGDIGPFQCAILLTVVALCLIYPWKENFGERNDSKSVASGIGSFTHSMRSSFNIAKESSIVLCLGLSQACFEGGMYTFVFMWVPSLLAVQEDANLPTGLIFSCFMLSMTLGGMLFGLLESIFPGCEETLGIAVYFLSALAMAVPLVKFQFSFLFVSFLVFEAMVGMFYSCGAKLRSKWYPEQHQSSIMTLFRVPLNILVVVGTKVTATATSSNEQENLQMVFGLVSIMFLTAMMLQTGLLSALKEERRRQARRNNRPPHMKSASEESSSGYSTALGGITKENITKRN